SSRPRPLTPPTPLSHRPPPDRERGERQKRRPSCWLFSLFSRSGGGRWEKRAGGMRGLGGGTCSKVSACSTPLRRTDKSRTGHRAVVALITPALFSQPPPRPPGEEGERPLIPPILLFCHHPLRDRETRENSQFLLCRTSGSPLSRPAGGRLGERGWGSEGLEAADRAPSTRWAGVITLKGCLEEGVSDSAYRPGLKSWATDGGPLRDRGLILDATARRPVPCRRRCRRRGRRFSPRRSRGLSLGTRRIHAEDEGSGGLEARGQPRLKRRDPAQSAGGEAAEEVVHAPAISR